MKTLALNQNKTSFQAVQFYTLIILAMIGIVTVMLIKALLLGGKKLS